jgi:hypothetical protein
MGVLLVLGTGAPLMEPAGIESAAGGAQPANRKRPQLPSCTHVDSGARLRRGRA